jgi:putative transposase
LLKRKKSTLQDALCNFIIQKWLQINFHNQKFISIFLPHHDLHKASSKPGWLNLAIVMDLYSRRIIGWSMQSRMTEQMTIDALEMAILSRRPTKSLIHHSDQGTQYQSRALQEKFKKYKILPSMNRKGNCYDNAVVESFFKTLKSELGVLQNKFTTREEARATIFEYIEVFYNRRRIHSTLGYVSPCEFELKHDGVVSVH